MLKYLIADGFEPEYSFPDLSGVKNENDRHEVWRSKRCET